MTPKASNVSIVHRHSLLHHLMGILDRIVTRPVWFPHSLQPGSGSQVPGVSSATDAIPRPADPKLHRTPYTNTTYQYVDVWRAPALKFEEPQHTDARKAASQFVQEVVQVALYILAIVGKFSGVREGEHRGKRHIGV